MSAAVVALALCAGSGAQAAERTFFGEFEAICLSNLQDPTAWPKAAQQRGYVQSPDDPGILHLDDADRRFVFLGEHEDSPPHISPPVRVSFCTLGLQGAPVAAVNKAIGEWASLPAIETSKTVEYRFRLEAGRRIPVDDSPGARAAALKLGPVYSVEVRTRDDLLIAEVERMTLRR